MPFRFATKVVITAALAVGGLSLLGMRVFPKPSDLMAGAVHFKKALEEFQKGFTAVVFGATAGAPGVSKKEREANRILID